MGLTSAQARRFYDRFGRAQDLQAFYEDRAVSRLLARSQLPAARSVFELGCGTGRLAAKLLAGQMPPDSVYLGADVSGTMVALCRERLRPFAGRATVIRADGTCPLPAADGAFDRFLLAYVLDLLSADDAARVAAEARRLLRRGGLLCAVSLAPGVTPGTRLVSRAWAAVWSRAPGLVGGCRPITIGSLLAGWEIEHRELVCSRGLTSEVVVARR